MIASRRGINLREHGSGNIGGTNVWRVIGKREGILTVAGDMLKGTAAVLIARALGAESIWLALAAFAAIVGHNFPLYYRFRGGKGVATTFGVLFGYMPWVGVASLLVWFAAARLSRTSSVGALTMGGLLPVLTFLLDKDVVRIGFSLAVSLMLLVRHKDNIQRLLQRKELKC
jgi:glycerol-3-phosphate acyltransferase PlsY